ncbi:hypothetical protein Pmar_PMAR024877 [Perkinsus marinus ATCC 50983]|uniref:Uncharacterized protein n=1 Tax=Perkinsus marinus (strain ATCC 50983 / TXsc) TaxID=423536 RepID=C5LCW1_PERM5|nr:hypothetical protein Pmar_PMAR024877 [Perkinsus marinus ATCC 50983]EER05414.1 hypothetical protein Pmar_PMAR024877 [Perkinsus marinus ATCC 50983]|eukprot:XP_002773598.1 hypothetical protein Pmar_PMAR024877 [Perkinsus marinus ATCC 50983]
MADGSAAAAMLLPKPWSMASMSPDVESMELANLPVRRWLEKTPAAEAPKRTVGEFYGAKVDPRTILALHQ